ncbi:hypothetical protein E4U39_002965 [Claviceps sp. Clav50 group G5]|nr:hypothetical protein E4U39_002965 [Claviceps sp. Clav50 group G5]
MHCALWTARLEKWRHLRPTPNGDGDSATAAVKLAKRAPLSELHRDFRGSMTTLDPHRFSPAALGSA